MIKYDYQINETTILIFAFSFMLTFAQTYTIKSNIILGAKRGINYSKFIGDDMPKEEFC